MPTILGLLRNAVQAARWVRTWCRNKRRMLIAASRTVAWLFSLWISAHTLGFAFHGAMASEIDADPADQISDMPQSVGDLVFGRLLPLIAIVGVGVLAYYQSHWSDTAILAHALAETAHKVRIGWRAGKQLTQQIRNWIEQRLTQGDE